MKPIVQHYYDDQEVKKAVEKLSSKGIKKEDLYVLFLDDERTKRVANESNANEVNTKELGVGTAVANMFTKKGDELRTQLKELGFSQSEANGYEEELDTGKILLIIANEEEVTKG